LGRAIVVAEKKGGGKSPAVWYWGGVRHLGKEARGGFKKKKKKKGKTGTPDGAHSKTCKGQNSTFIKRVFREDSSKGKKEGRQG